MMKMLLYWAGLEGVAFLALNGGGEERKTCDIRVFMVENEKFFCYNLR